MARGYFAKSVGIQKRKMLGSVRGSQSHGQRPIAFRSA
jgi:hypothetical protein